MPLNAVSGTIGVRTPQRMANVRVRYDGVGADGVARPNTAAGPDSCTWRVLLQVFQHEELIVVGPVCQAVEPKVQAAGSREHTDHVIPSGFGREPFPEIAELS